jgi:transitional endoplasmic reticulum ATPase
LRDVWSICVALVSLTVFACLSPGGINTSLGTFEALAVAVAGVIAGSRFGPAFAALVVFGFTWILVGVPSPNQAMVWPGEIVGALVMGAVALTGAIKVVRAPGLVNGRYWCAAAALMLLLLFWQTATMTLTWLWALAFFGLLAAPLLVKGSLQAEAARERHAERRAVKRAERAEAKRLAAKNADPARARFQRSGQPEVVMRKRPEATPQPKRQPSRDPEEKRQARKDAANVFYRSSPRQDEDKRLNPDDVPGMEARVPPRYTFADVHGLAEMKDELHAVGRTHRLYLQAVKDAEDTDAQAEAEYRAAAAKAARAGKNAPEPPTPAPRPVAPASGVLLYGPPGNGKTFMAEALAGELHLPFYKFTQGDAACRWINATTENLTKAFEAVAAAGPCVFLIDEIDNLLVKRENIVQAEHEARQLTNAFLNWTSRFFEAGVLLVGATNHRDMLDSAAIRPGRLEHHIQVPPPDAGARRAILAQYLAHDGTPIAIDKALANALVKLWEGWSFVKLKALCQRVAERAVERRTDENALTVTYADFEEAGRKLASGGVALADDTPGIGGVILQEPTKQALAGLVHMMRHPDEVMRYGGTMPSGALFYGPPGTGKTLSARALAKETGWAFFPTTGYALMGRDAIDKLAEQVSDARPAIIFIDEADDILAKRASGASPVLNRLLAVMDGAEARLKGVFFLAATNRPEAIDKAARRSGRFGLSIEFPLPEPLERAQFIRLWRAQHPDTPFTAEAGNSEALAMRLKGFCFADLGAILDGAVNRMITRPSADKEVSVADIEDAMRPYR